MSVPKEALFIIRRYSEAFKPVLKGFPDSQTNVNTLKLLYKDRNNGVKPTR